MYILLYMHTYVWHIYTHACLCVCVYTVDYTKYIHFFSLTCLGCLSVSVHVNLPHSFSYYTSPLFTRPHFVLHLVSYEWTFLLFLGWCCYWKCYQGPVQLRGEVQCAGLASVQTAPFQFCRCCPPAKYPGHIPSPPLPHFPHVQYRKTESASLIKFGTGWRGFWVLKTGSGTS